MDATSQRQLLFDAVEGVAFIATAGSLNEAVRNAGVQNGEASSYWFLVQTDDTTENANLFFQATFGMPEGVRVVMRQLGHRFDKDSQQEMPVVVMEAQASGTLDAETQAKLEQLGFRAFHSYVFDSALRSQLEELGFEVG